MSSSLFQKTVVPTPASTPLVRFERQVSALTTLTQKNAHIFASPLGRISLGERHAWMPRFVFFGPNTTDESWRLAFLAGFDAGDLRASQALLHLVEALGKHTDDGYGLNLTFFPLVDVAGTFLNISNRGLANAHWGASGAPEIALLERDARLRGYHGFVRVETAAAGDDVISIRVREPFGIAPAPDVELISTDEAGPFAVRFEREAFAAKAEDGPLAIADDLIVAPFELTLRVPASWTDELYFNAVGSILGRFVLRYRAFQAYGQHL